MTVDYMGTLILFPLLTLEVNTFNKEVPDHPDVRYFSIGGGKPGYGSPLYFFYKMLYKKEGPNDGLVSTLSAQWGKYLGNLEEDHIQQMGWTIKRDARYVYRGIAEILAKQEMEMGINSIYKQGTSQ